MRTEYACPEKQSASYNINNATEVDLRLNELQVVGSVTQYINELYRQSQKALALAPSPIELLHHFQCDHNMLRKSSIIYKAVNGAKMMRSRSNQNLRPSQFYSDVNQALASKLDATSACSPSTSM